LRSIVLINDSGLTIRDWATGNLPGYLRTVTLVILSAFSTCPILASPTTEPGRRGWSRRLGSPDSTPHFFAPNSSSASRKPFINTLSSLCNGAPASSPGRRKIFTTGSTEGQGTQGVRDGEELTRYVMERRASPPGLD